MVSQEFEGLVRRVTGVVGGLPYDSTEYCILAAASAIAWAYCLELTLLAFYTFRRWSGLYFYSLLISSWGCTFHALSFVLKFLTHTPSGCFLVFIEMGWVAMVTGQAFVLFSRLHLVVRQRGTLRLVLAMICVNAVCLHTPTIILTIGSNSAPASAWAPVFNIMERIQLALFCIQEFTISTIYIYCTVRLLGSIYHSRTREVMVELIIINAACLSMDVVLIGLEYSNNYVGETSVKAMLYAIKLKLEFAVLNQLMTLARAGLTEGASHWPSEPVARHEQEMPNRSLVTEVDPEAVTTRHDACWPPGRRGFHGSFTSKHPKDPTIRASSHFVGGISTTRRITVTSEPRSQGNVGGSHPIHRAKDPLSSDRVNPGQSMERHGGGGEDGEWSPRASRSTERMLQRNSSTEEVSRFLP